MSRTIPSNVSSALSDAFLIPVIFVQLEFDSGTLYLHTDIGNITTTDTSPNKTWVGAGDLGKVGEMEERNDLSPTAVVLTLSGLDSTLADECLNQNYFERPAALYISLRNTVTGELLDPPFEIYKGQIDDMEISSSAVSTAIRLTLESELKEFDRGRLTMYSNEQQQTEYSGDLFFEYMAEVVNKQLKWQSGKIINVRKGSVNGPG